MKKMLVILLIGIFGGFSLAYGQNWRAENDKIEKEQMNGKLDTEQAVKKAHSMWKKYMDPIKIGMTRDEVLKLTGLPDSIETVTMRGKVFERWLIYKWGQDLFPVYFYFQNDMLVIKKEGGE